jgi:murein DD-endopeptidase MepM/ murein hydrolase activator NlpD
MTPEERTMSLMRAKNPSINPTYSSGDLQMPDYGQMLQAKPLDVGNNQPSTQQVDNNEDTTGDFTNWVKGLSDKYGISQQFGNKSSMYKSGAHSGLDIPTPTGTDLTSPVNGSVNVGFDPKGYGRFVQITTPNGEVIQFSHLSDTSDFVKQLMKLKDRVISKGQSIGKTGGATTDPNRGLSTGSHVDITYKRGGQFINPLGVKS